MAPVSGGVCLSEECDDVTKPEPVPFPDAPKPNQPIVLERADYWMLRTRFLEHQALLAKVGRSQEAIQAVMLACGLDPMKHYGMDDDTHSVLQRS